MKAIRRTIIFPVLFFLTLFSAWADPLTDGIYARERLMQPYREEIAAASSNEISASSIGEWYEILETSLFMLMRKTEVFRGSMRLIITDQQTARCMLYPDGTFLISSGLLDYIDSVLFLDAAGSARRIRNFNTERENFFAPIAAVAAAQFALNYYPGTAARTLPNDRIYTIDILANVFLDIAGYPRSLLETWLTYLERAQSDKGTAAMLRSFVSGPVSAHERLEQLYNNSEAVTHLYEEISGILFALQNRRGTLDARNILENLRQLFPESIYMHRLNALICHQAWLNSLDQREKELATILPAAIYDPQTVFSFFQAVDIMPDDGRYDHEADYLSKSSPIKGNSKIYAQAKKAYGDYLCLMYEAGIAASYAHLLTASPLAHERDAVLKIAEQADLFHAAADDVSARANYAALLYLVAKDYTKARILLSECLQAVNRKNTQKLFLTTGFPADERLIRCNLIRMLNRLNEKEAAAQEKKRLSAILQEPNEDVPIVLRNISLGTSVDDLLRAWNEPSSIIYNYYSERWLYRLLNTEIIIRAKNQGGTVLQMTIGFPSSLTLFNDVRTGDSRDAFETICGKPLYRSCDAFIYHRKGSMLQVIYGNNKIRNVTIRKINEKR